MLVRLAEFFKDGVYIAKILGFVNGHEKWVDFFLSSLVCQVIAMYEYVANNEDELNFGKGQLINVINKDDADWWQGEINGVTGLFPSNYVKMTTECDPSTQCEYLLSCYLPVLTLFSF